MCLYERNIFMYKVVRKKQLNPTMIQVEIEAPLVARKAKPGQFVILRVDSEGERIPLSYVGANPEEGTVKVVFQIAGATTVALSHKNEGDYISDFAGPLGQVAETDGIKKVCVVGGGSGCAIAMPIAEEFHRLGAEVTSIIGFRNKDLVILEDEFRSFSDRLTVMTDDGSYARKGNVTVPLKEMLEAGEMFDIVITIGPLVMMKYVTLTVKPYGIPVRASMNPIMIDGTGMCGGCRVTLIQDGERVTKFACIDGPDFNAYEIDFDEAISRGQTYCEQEHHAYEETCNLFKYA